MLYIAEFVTILLWSVAAARGREGDPCGDYKHGDPRYRIVDPYNCKKFWMCIVGHDQGSHFLCPAGTSFIPDLLGSCNGPPSWQVKGCFKSKGKWTDWTAWTECGDGISQRTRTCLGEGDHVHCEGESGSVEYVCPADKPNCQCPSTRIKDKGEFEPWSEWGDCSTTCGEGTRKRTRTCPAQRDCIGDSIQSEPCLDNPKCTSEFEQWSKWEDCSTTCGEGTRTRKRECLGPYECIGNATQSEPCLDNPKCTSEFEEWSKWEDCSTTCGEGTRTRKRECQGPYECIGNATQSEPCPDNPKCTGDIFIKKETCQFAKFPKYYTSCKNDATICSDSGGEFNPCEGDTPDPENIYFCTAEIPDIPELKRPWVKCSDECFDANSDPKEYDDTTSCSADATPCKFPFKVNEKTYTSCTDDIVVEDDDVIIIDNDGTKKQTFQWCATSVNENQFMKKDKWGICDL